MPTALMQSGIDELKQEGFKGIRKEKTRNERGIN